MSGELNALREEIDRLDGELVRLFCERMAVCERIAALKASANLPVTNENREAEVLSRAAEAAPDEIHGETIAFMKTLISLSKIRQSKLLRERNLSAKNVVFIGMPGCGKSTVSERVARVMNRQWFDSDAEIVSAEGMAIPEIFAVKGEEYFRQREAEHILRLLSGQSSIISAGGGSALRLSDVMRENAVVVYLCRDNDNIMRTMEAGTRPLVSSKEQLDELFERRRGVYEATAHITVDNNGDIEDTVIKAVEALRKREVKDV